MPRLKPRETLSNIKSIKTNLENASRLLNGIFEYADLLPEETLLTMFGEAVTRLQSASDAISKTYEEQKQLKISHLAQVVWLFNEDEYDM